VSIVQQVARIRERLVVLGVPLAEQNKVKRGSAVESHALPPVVRPRPACSMWPSTKQSATTVRMRRLTSLFPPTLAEKQLTESNSGQRFLLCEEALLDRTLFGLLLRQLLFHLLSPLSRHWLREDYRRRD
jgi:hypothetical protein